ncbi:MAG: dTDP-4-dehydrorhamnose reductase [Chloroflexota bacterium]
MVRTAVIGAASQLGRHVPADVRLGHQDIDLAEPETIARALDAAMPGGVVLTAAYTDVDGCETNREYAERVNGEGPGHVARWCERNGAWLVYISTDYVFDGQASTPYREDDAPHPINTYGLTKLRGERAVQEACGRHYIVRASWIFGPGGNNFIAKILAAASRGAPLRGVDNEISAPTYALDLAGKLTELAASGQYGLYHLPNAGSCSRLAYMHAILHLAGVNLPIEPIKLADYPRAARPPAYSVLENVRGAALGMYSRSWREALREYMQRAAASPVPSVPFPSP